ncbi:MAG TPA: hypothetical protein VMZ02_11360 [Candidatus Limnocylindrales bacterium]|jgi:heme-degrading monooxygenase HmoA|nr:hypothetical protein [Candidatus Limnocylindrales bacterium]
MFSRNVSYKLKAKSAAEFTRIVEGEVIPLLRRQKGFDDAISFIAPERNEAVTISLWDKKEDAEAYIDKTYPEILKALASVVEGHPKVESFEIGNSTSHQIAASPVN